MPALGPVLGPQQNHVQHRQALPHREVAAALAIVRASDTAPVVTLAFEFLVLTAARSGEVRLATWVWSAASGGAETESQFRDGRRRAPFSPTSATLTGERDRFRPLAPPEARLTEDEGTENGIRLKKEGQRATNIRADLSIILVQLSNRIYVTNGSSGAGTPENQVKW